MGKDVKAMSSDVLKPRYRATYIIVSNEPKTIKIRYACGDEAGEQEVTLSRTARYTVELLMVGD
ncbi:hypothetical protein [Vulcanisaeta sp. JCM 16161]|uniref:hypothetical protein n=1 Tax=Vulcanisaeta sp. JCM 16161 TaxID=1295372 RepID=UPI001FB3D6DA|nr:hypothetical protein [Vulcanisaeta sp. JCM 16161]